jgi:hypothetical protein
MANQVKNGAALKEMPIYGRWLFQSLQDLAGRIQNIGQQTNASPQGQQSPAPPAVDELRVFAGGGVAHLQAVHNGPIYRGVTYHFHAAALTDPSFSSPVTLYSGPNRDVRIPVGTAPLHYAVTCDYPTSPSSPVTFHTAGGVAPVPVAASGTEQPAMPAGQGSGTGTPGQISGFGPIPYRGNTPPRRA